MQEPRDPASDEPNLPTSELATPPAGRPSRWGRYAGTAVAVFFGLSGIAGVVSFLAGPDVPSAILVSAYGQPYRDLPSDFRSAMESRIEAVVPADFREFDAGRQTNWFRGEADDGLVRLDDPTLTRSFLLEVVAKERMPIEACGEMVRALSSGGDVTKSTWIAFLTGLDTAGRMEWIEIDVAAIEAEARGTRIPRIVSQNEADRAFGAIDALASPGEASAIQAIGAGTTPGDAEWCSGVRAFGTAAMRLSATDLATIARYRVQP